MAKSSAWRKIVNALIYSNVWISLESIGVVFTTIVLAILRSSGPFTLKNAVS